jgi:hypothetical protein
MAARFISITDFIGEYNINDQYFDEEIVESTEEQILRDLLGNTLYDEFIADLVDGEPQAQKWIDFKDGKDYEDTIRMHYQGITEMLVAFSYYALIQWVTNSNSTGFTKNDNQNSKVFNKFEADSLSYSRYNLGVNFYVQAERFLAFYPDDYTPWNHKQKSYKTLIRY